MSFSNRLYGLGASGNPVVQTLSLLVFGVVLIGAVLMGALILSLVFGLLVIGAVAFSLRLWWIRRKLARRAASQPRHRPATGRLIDAEYSIVAEREPVRRRRD